MITIFNRKELTVTYSVEQNRKIRKALADNNIDYHMKVVNRLSPSPASAGMRGRSGSIGFNTNYIYIYYFYVHKKDYDEALKVIQSCIVTVQ